MGDKKRPIGVVISDIHFNLNTLPLASAALKAALDKAAELNVPTIIAGDLHDTKDIIRGKVANQLILLLKQAKTPVHILVGNHDLLNEKASDHGLNYLAPYAHIVEDLSYDWGLKLILVPYQNDSQKIVKFLKDVTSGVTLIMHQGFLGAAMGDYVQDKTSIDPKIVKDFTVISGHYHRHQTIGTVTYIGSPYTITFGEANDGPKGFLILNQDGSFEREILNLRKHVIIEARVIEEVLQFEEYPNLGKDDLIWLKISGSYSELKKIKKKDLADKFFGHSNFKLDLIPDAASPLEIQQASKKTDSEVFDILIDNLQEVDEYKAYLKDFWRKLL